MSVEPILQTHAASSGAVAILEGLANILSQFLGGLVREWRIRRDLGRVVEFDDAMLRDMGIARSEIESALRHGRSLRHRTAPLDQHRGDLSCRLQ